MISKLHVPDLVRNLHARDAAQNHAREQLKYHEYFQEWIFLTFPNPFSVL